MMGKFGFGALIILIACILAFLIRFLVFIAELEFGNPSWNGSMRTKVGLHYEGTAAVTETARTALSGGPHRAKGLEA